jgi:hypothetical protein
MNSGLLLRAQFYHNETAVGVHGFSVLFSWQFRESGRVAEWQSGRVAEWQSGRVAEWPSDQVIEVQSGSAKVRKCVSIKYENGNYRLKRKN